MARIFQIRQIYPFFCQILKQENIKTYSNRTIRRHKRDNELYFHGAHYVQRQNIEIKNLLEVDFLLILASISQFRSATKNFFKKK